jgi:hypothetical protein
VKTKKKAYCRYGEEVESLRRSLERGTLRRREHVFR